MRRWQGIALLTVLVASGQPLVCRGEEWTNREGKTITAVFVRTHEDGTTVVLRQGEEVYEVPLANLDGTSHKQALRLQKEKTAWAGEQVRCGIMPEEVLLDLAQFDPLTFNHKRYLVRGAVAEITSGALSTGPPEFRLEGGTICSIDISKYGNPSAVRFDVSKERIVLMATLRSTGLRTFGPVLELVSRGGLVTILAEVRGDGLVGLGLPQQLEARQAAERGTAVPFKTHQGAQGRMLPGLLTSPSPTGEAS